MNVASVDSLFAANNAVVLILAIAAAYVFSLYGMQPFTLTGEIPAGLPPFRPPAFSVSDGNGTVYGASDIFQVRLIYRKNLKLNSLEILLAIYR